MPKKIYDFKISVKYVCPNKKEETVITILNHCDFFASEQQCACCGSHGGIEVRVRKCVVCKKEHILIINSW